MTCNLIQFGSNAGSIGSNWFNWFNWFTFEIATSFFQQFTSVERAFDSTNMWVCV